MTLAKQYKQLASQALARASSEKSGEQVEWQRLSERYMQLAEQAEAATVVWPLPLVQVDD